MTVNENNHADEGDTSKDRNGILDSETAQTIIEDPDLIDFISDFEEDSLRKNEREVQLKWYLRFIYISILLAWLLGSWNFSVLWVVLFIGAVYFIWWDTLSRYIEESVAFATRQVHRRRALQNEETAEWFNFILNRWWVFSSSSIFSWVKANFEPLLNETKPAIIDTVILKACTFGDKTPFISSIKAFDGNGVTTRRRSPLFNSSLKTQNEDSTAKMNLVQSLKYRLIIQADVGIICPEFKLTITGKWKAGGQMNFSFEKLELFGRIQIAIQFSMDAAFPHLSKATVTFLSRPKVNLSRTSLNNTPLPDLFGVSNWVNSIVNDILSDVMVDPYKLDLDLSVRNNMTPAVNPRNSLARGVLEVEVGWANKIGKPLSGTKTENEWRRCLLRIGDQEYVTSSSVDSSSWTEMFAFLIDSFSEKLIIKVKTKKVKFFRETSAKFCVDLESRFKNGISVYEEELSKNGIGISLKMKYTSLPSIDCPDMSNIDVGKGDRVDGTENIEKPLLSGEKLQNCVAGVMHICIHGADGLPSIESSSLPSSYCVVICESRKLKVTHFVPQSSSPCWESNVEFIVFDYTKTVISLAVCNWDITNMTEAGLLGTAGVSLQPGQWRLIKHTVSLELYAGDITDDKQYGSITVSIIFRPVPSLGQTQSVGSTPNKTDCSLPHVEDRFHQPLVNSKSITAPLVNTTKMLVPELDTCLNSISSALAAGHGIMEVTVIRAMCLIAKDFNGLSDPFFEIKINQEHCYKSTIKKRTLNPEWMEKVTVRLPKQGDIFTVVLWDHDKIGKDFLGSVSFTMEEIQKLALKNESGCFPLGQTAKSGEIEMKFKIISEGLEEFDPSPSTTTPLTTNEKCHSPQTPNFDSCHPFPNYYGEGDLNASSSILLDQHLTRDEPDFAMETFTRVKRESQESPAQSLSKPSASLQKDSVPMLSSVEFTNAILPPSTFAHLSSALSYSEDGPKHENIQSETVNLRNNSTTHKSKLTTLKPVPVPLPPERNSSLPASSNTNCDISHSNATDLSASKSPIVRGSPAYSSLHEMKKKVKKKFSHPLRRFRSEASVHEDKAKNFQNRVMVETQEDVHSSCINIDKLKDEDPSLYNDQYKSRDETGTAAGVQQTKSQRYYNIEGCVTQALGIDLKGISHICCRVRLYPSSLSDSNSRFAPKTLSKTKLIPFSSNPTFNLRFELSSSHGFPTTSMLSFEIRNSNKDIVASSKSITLLDLFGDVIEEGDEMRTCLSLSCGGTLELSLSRGKQNESQEKSRGKVTKLLRSWSVHRIGKI